MVTVPHISPSLIIIGRQNVKERVKSVRGNRYIVLTNPIPDFRSNSLTGPLSPLSPAPRDLIPVTPIYHTSTSGPLYGLLLEVKRQWRIPIDNGVAGRIGGQYYMFHPCPETIVDVIPLHKLKPEITNQYIGTIQKLLLFRYLFGLNMSATNIYARPLLRDGAPVVEGGYPVFENFYSGAEAQPFGLRNGSKGCVSIYVEKKSWRFTPTLLKRYFPQVRPSEVLKQWWGIIGENEYEKLGRLYSWLDRLIGNERSYSVLPSFVYNRAVQLLQEW